MSWSEDEWKSGLPYNALERITFMEESLESFRKEINQYKYKTENLERHLDDTKKKLEDVNKEKCNLERNLSDLYVKHENEQEKSKRLCISFNKKESIIQDLNERTNTLKQDNDKKCRLIEKLEFQLETLNSKYIENDLKAKEITNKLNQASVTSSQRIEGK